MTESPGRSSKLSSLPRVSVFKLWFRNISMLGDAQHLAHRYGLQEEDILQSWKWDTDGVSKHLMYRLCLSVVYGLLMCIFQVREGLRLQIEHDIQSACILVSTPYCKRHILCRIPWEYASHASCGICALAHLIFPQPAVL